MKPKTPTIAQLRESLIEDYDRRLYCGNKRNSETSITVLVECLTATLRPLNDKRDAVQFAGWPGALLITPLRDWLPFAMDPRLTIEYLPAYQGERDHKPCPALRATCGPSHAIFKYCEIAGPIFVFDLDFDTAPPADYLSILDPWIGLARAKNTYRRALAKHWGNAATDGQRLHFDRTLATREVANITPPPIADVLQLGRTADNFALMQTRDLIAAAKRCKALKNGPMTVTVNGSLEFMAGDAKVGQTHGAITENYSHIGDVVTFNLDPALLLDAITPMSGDVLIAIRPRETPQENGYYLYVASGTREAVMVAHPVKR